MREHENDNRDPRTHSIIGAGFEVNRVLGTGFLEGVITEALAIEFANCNIPFMTEVAFPVIYKGHKLSGHYRADFVCFESIIVEVKASARNPELDQAQMLNYLRASGLEHGLLLNFAGPQMTVKRFVRFGRVALTARQSKVSHNGSRTLSAPA